MERIGLKWLLVAALAVVAVGVLFRLAVGAAPGGARVTSWWRTGTHNKAVGGAKHSRHLFGLAYDVQPKNEAMRNYLERLGLSVLPDAAYPSHLHAQVTWRTPFLLLARLAR